MRSLEPPSRHDGLSCPIDQALDALRIIRLARDPVVLGLFASFLAFNGWQASTMGANSARMAFQLAVTPDVMMVAGLLGLAIGVFGGALPAFAATRLPLTMALRARW